MRLQRRLLSTALTRFHRFPQEETAANKGQARDDQGSKFNQDENHLRRSWWLVVKDEFS
jgi:hypothetical protein